MIKAWILPVTFALLITAGLVPAYGLDPPSGFTLIKDWNVYANDKGVFWNAGVQWRLKDGTWVRLQAGNWITDPAPPAVIVAIPKDHANCPPGLAKKGCIPPGQQKKQDRGGPPGQSKKE